VDQRPTILIVDDEPFNVDCLEQELEDLLCDTISASNGLEALGQVAAEAPDLILLDIMMPKMDGFEVLTKLKQDEKTRDIPVIVISALDELDAVVKGIELGAEDFIPKPFDPILLQARMSNSLEKKRWRDKEQVYLRQIEEEKKRSNELLHIILPDPIVYELKTTDSVRPRLFDEVSVLFTDVVGFTPYAENHDAVDVVQNLQQLIVAYEDVAIGHDLQKIKTIGDAFMASGGLFKKLDNPVLNSLRCGLEMVEMAKEVPAGWQVRVGIHVGPVMGGIVGKRQFLFDIWGDTVNTAQRIESHGAAGRVNLSQTAWEMVQDLCIAQNVGTADVKGKGLMEIYQVLEMC
jgi:CheY-like chemotaxis protein